MEADLPDRRRSPIDVRVELSFAPERIHDEPRLTGEEELAEVHVPVAGARPPDVLARRDGLTGLDERIDVPVAEVTDVHEAPYTGRRGEEHGAALDRVHAMRASARRAALGPIVPDRDVHAVVVDRAALRVGPGVEKGAADRMLPLARAHRPASPGVVVGLRKLELPGDRQLNRSRARPRRP